MSVGEKGTVTNALRRPPNVPDSGRFDRGVALDTLR